MPSRRSRSHRAQRLVEAPRRGRPVFSAVIALTVAATLLLMVSGCAERGGMVAISSPPAPSAEEQSDSEYARATNEPSNLAGLRVIAEGVPGASVRAGDLLVTLEHVGPGPFSDIEGGPTLSPRPWTERLSARIVVRNAGTAAAAIALRDNYPEVQDDKGHLRPYIDGVGRISAEGLPKDDSGRTDYDHLSPGGTVTILQAFEIRTDDHDRPMYLSLRVSPETLVRFKLW